MATITSAQAGNWSATSTWVGGVVPTSVDDVNVNHTIEANVDIVVLSINASVGRLNITTARNITCSGSGIIFSGGHLKSLWITAGVGQVVNITSNILITAYITGASGTVQNAINITGSATINIIGTITNNVSIGDTVSSSGYAVYVNSNNSIVNIIGNLIGSVAVTNSRSALRINGVSTTINITGNLSANGGCAIDGSGTGNINVNGIISSTISNHTINVSGILIIVSGNITNVSNRIAILSSLIQLSSTINTQWLFQTDNALVNRTLYTAGLLTGYPAEADVESGVIYGPSSEFEGTLSPVNIDTAQLAEDLLSEISTSSNALAERLRNVSTVQTTGTQISALTLS